MSVTRGTFLGATVKSLELSMGWSDQASQLSVRLVEDDLNGDLFSPGVTDDPVFFSFGSLTFGGLLQSWHKSVSVAGLEYEVRVVAPNKILEGAKVILSGYSGEVPTGVRNLINAYGYWESQSGFGTALVNQAGMPWYKIRQALEDVCNSPYMTIAGGPLTLGGYQYALDLSELPTPPPSYRIEGGVQSILQLIQRVCQDGGCDFFIELVGFVIRVRVVSRATQPPTGALEPTVGTGLGTTISSYRHGVESVDGTTEAFLIGGQQCGLHLASGTSAIRQYWGNDLNGSPILGTRNYYLWEPRWGAGEPPPVRFAATKPANVGDWEYLSVSGPYETMTLNAAKVGHILGSVSYFCSDLEMRFALDSYESWSTFIQAQRSDIAALIIAPFIPQEKQPGDFVKIDAANEGQAAEMADIEEDFAVRSNELYEFVKLTALEYLGRKYAVTMPFVLTAQDPDTLQVTYSNEVAQGGYLPEGAEGALGLSTINGDVFREPDGRFGAMARYDSILGADLTQLGDSNVVIETNEVEAPDGYTVPTTDRLFVRIGVEPRYIAIPGPAVVVTLPAPLWETPFDGVGGSDEVIRAAMQLASDDARGQKVLRGDGGHTGLRCAPAVRAPDLVVVPIQSNILTYGPWYSVGATGAVNAEQDANMTPWAFGSWEAMNAAGLARVNQAVRFQQAADVGERTEVGAPACGLGEALVEGGPVVNSMSLSWGESGVTTTYSWRTFTERFGRFSQANVERMKVFSLAAASLRQKQRQLARDRLTVNGLFREAGLGRRAWMAEAPKPIKKKSPHEVLVGQARMMDDGTARVPALSSTIEESFGLAYADDNQKSVNVGMMSMDGLVRPFRGFRRGGWPGGLDYALPAYTSPTAPTGALTVRELDPWGSFNDIQAYLYGAGWEAACAYRNGHDGDAARPMALRGPLVVAGWGLDLQGNVAPAGMSTSSGAPVTDNARLRSDQWKVGPVDLLWAEHRGVWTCHDVAVGSTASTPEPGASTTLSLSGGGSLDVFAPETGQTIALYSPDLNRWLLLPTPSGSASSTIPSGDPWSLFHRPASGDPLWSRTPTIHGLTAGGFDPAADGFLGVYTSGGYGHRIENSLSLNEQRTWRLPANEPGTGDVLSVIGSQSGVYELAWASGTGAAALPTPEPYSVLWSQAGGAGTAEWTGAPETPSVWVGGEGVSAQPGFLALGHPSGATYFYLEAALQDSSTTIRMPSGTPTSGDVLTIGTWTGAGRIGQLTWRRPTPSGNPHEVLYHGFEQDPYFTGLPTIKGIYLGGSGVSPTDGELALGTPDSTSYLYLASRPSTGDVHLALPSTMRPPTGFVMRVESAGEGWADLAWQDPLPEGDAYSVLNRSASGPLAYAWTTTPTAWKWKAGNATLGAGSVDLWSGSGAISLKAGSQPHDWDLLLPVGMPVVGDLIRVSSVDATLRVVQLAWVTPGSGCLDCLGASSGTPPSGGGGGSGVPCPGSPPTLPESEPFISYNSLLMSATNSGVTPGGNGSEAHTWYDISTAANDAAQGTSANRPIFYTNQVNGLEALEFDGVDDYMTFGTPLDMSNGGFTCFMVTKATTAGYVIGGNTNGFEMASGGNFNKVGVAYIGGPSESPPADTWVCVGSRWNSSTGDWKARSYLGEDSTGNSSQTLSITNSYVGASVGAAVPAYFDGQVAEIVYCNGPVSDAEFDAIWNYLVCKYALGDLYIEP